MGRFFIDEDGNRLGEYYSCSDGEDHEGEAQCGHCSPYDNWHTEDEVIDGWCIECAEAAYTDILGLKFICEYDLVGEYYDAENNISLKDYCFEFMDTWVEFLNRKDIKPNQMRYEERKAV